MAKPKRVRCSVWVDGKWQFSQFCVGLDSWLSMAQVGRDDLPYFAAIQEYYSLGGVELTIEELHHVWHEAKKALRAKETQ